MLDLNKRLKPLHGQRSLLPDVPPVCRCRVCQQELQSASARAKGIGPTCELKQSGQYLKLWRCRRCKKISDSLGICDHCGSIRGRSVWRRKTEGNGGNKE